MLSGKFEIGYEETYYQLVISLDEFYSKKLMGKICSKVDLYSLIEKTLAYSIRDDEDDLTSAAYEGLMSFDIAKNNYRPGPFYKFLEGGSKKVNVYQVNYPDYWDYWDYFKIIKLEVNFFNYVNIKKDVVDLFKKRFTKYYKQYLIQEFGNFLPETKLSYLFQKVDVVERIYKRKVKI